MTINRITRPQVLTDRPSPQSITTPRPSWQDDPVRKVLFRVQRLMPGQDTAVDEVYTVRRESSAAARYWFANRPYNKVATVIEDVKAYMESGCLPKRGEQLNDTQIAILAYWRAYTREQGRPPSPGECAVACGLTKSNTSQHLRKLVTRGYLEERDAPEERRKGNRLFEFWAVEP